MHEIVSFSKEIEFRNMINKVTSISLEHTLMLDGFCNIKGDFIVSGTYKMTAATQIENDFSYKIPVDIEIDEKYDLTNLVIDIDDFTYEVVNESVLKVDINLLLDKLEIKKNERKEELKDEIEVLDDLFLECDDRKDLEIKDDDIEILDIELAKKENEDDKRVIDDVNEYDLKIEEKKIQEINLNNTIKDSIEYENKVIINDIDDSLKKLDNETSLFSSFDSSNETYSTYSVYIVRSGDTIDEILNKYKTTRDVLSDYNDLDNIKVGSKIIIPSGKNE